MFSSASCEKTPSLGTAKTAKSPFGSKDSSEGGRFSGNESAPGAYCLDYTAADLVELDALIERYVVAAFPEALRRPKRAQLLAARRKMCPVYVVNDIAEFRALVAEVETMASTR